MIRTFITAFGASTATWVLTGAEPWYAVLVAVPATVAVAFVSEVLFDRAYRDQIDVRMLFDGVCPACCTYNSLDEVTSADPDKRCVGCNACGERFSMSQTENGVISTRLGKL